MKTYSFVLMLFLTVLIQESFAEKQPKFFIVCRAIGDTATKYTGAYERTMASYLVEAFPCARAKTQGDINTRLAREVLNQRLAGGNAEMSSYCSDLACDYLLSLEISDFLSDQVVVSASCIRLDEIESIARDAKHGSRDYNSIKTLVNQVSMSIVDKLSKYEICAFIGPVTLSVRTEKDTTMIEEYGVYCNETDQRYRKETKDYSLTTSDWKLERKGIPWTSGTMTFNSEELQRIVEDNGCYKCQSSQREGGRTVTLKKSFKVNGSGISNLSVREGKPQQDTRVVIEFLANGTYIIKPKGTSDPATALEKMEEQAVGTCDNISPVKNETQREITIPLKYPFGPYPGKSTDKFLQQNETKVFRDPVNKEKTTVTIDFSLTQKGK